MSVHHKRARLNELEPKNEPVWLLVDNQYTELVFAREYPPLANRVHIMIEALATSVAKGYEVECLPGAFPLYFCRRGEYRHCVHLSPQPTADRMKSYLARQDREARQAAAR